MKQKFIIPFEYESKVITKSSDVRIYRNAVLLTPGEWTDSSSGMPTYFSEGALITSYLNWTTNYLNVNHSWNVEDRIGLIMNPKVRQGKLCGDLYIYPITQVAKDTIALIDAGLVNELSVEVLSDDKWIDGKRTATNLEFFGCAVVTKGACRETLIR